MSEPQRPTANLTLAEFTAELASARPTPGGGAAAAVAAALAASLAAMVVRLSQDRPAYASHAPLHAEALAASDVARIRFLALAEEDAAAYEAYRAARRMPRQTEVEARARLAATRQAARQAAEVPLTMVQACQAQVDLVERLAGRTNEHAASDLDVAAMLLESAARAAAANVSANLPAVEDEGFSAAVRAELAQRLQVIQTTADRAHERVARPAARRPEGE